MQQFPCPFCGLRDETEFRFIVETGHPRPEPAEQVSDEDWARYLYLHKSAKGQVSEIWLHLTCHEYFVLHRDTLTRAVRGSDALVEETG